LQLWAVCSEFLLSLVWLHALDLPEKLHGVRKQFPQVLLQLCFLIVGQLQFLLYLIAGYQLDSTCFCPPGITLQAVIVRCSLDAPRNRVLNTETHTAASILERIGKTPMVRLDRLATRLSVPILGKFEFLNSGGSGKDRIALAIVHDAERNSLIVPGSTLIEPTAGNTGMGLALVAAARGYRLVCVMPEKMTVDKRAALAALGAEVVIDPNAAPSSPDNFQNVARRLSEGRGWFLTEQFANAANPRIHEGTPARRSSNSAAGASGHSSATSARTGRLPVSAGSSRPAARTFWWSWPITSVPGWGIW
jgi:Pyridoxal-phosphate dependent enzyme